MTVANGMYLLNKYNIVILFVILLYMKRVRFNDVVEVKYFDKTKPLDNEKPFFSKFYIKISLVMFLLLVLLILVNKNS